MIRKIAIKAIDLIVNTLDKIAYSQWQKLPRSVRREISNATPMFVSINDIKLYNSDMPKSIAILQLSTIWFKQLRVKLHERS